MKTSTTVAAIALVLSACAPKPEPICNRDVPFTGKLGTAPVCSPVPKPRPVEPVDHEPSGDDRKPPSIAKPEPKPDPTPEPPRITL